MSEDRHEDSTININKLPACVPGSPVCSSDPETMKATSSSSIHKVPDRPRGLRPRMGPPDRMHRMVGVWRRFPVAPMMPHSFDGRPAASKASVALLSLVCRFMSFVCAEDYDVFGKSHRERGAFD